MLQNLNELTYSVRHKIELFDGIDMTLPSAFKEAVTSIDADRIDYGCYSSIITNTDGQHIFLSNSWFYIAAILVPLYEPFEDYFRVLNQYVDVDTLKSRNNTKIIEAIENNYQNNDDKEFLKKFATDPKWWTAGMTNRLRTLDRHDCLDSAILAIANVVNASQSYIATLWGYLGRHPDVVYLLNEELSKVFSSNPIIISETDLSQFAFKTVKVLEKEDKLASFVRYAVYSDARTTEGQLIKLSSDDFDEKLVGLFLYASSDTVKNRNSSSDTLRWFEEPFCFNEQSVYLSTQWYSESDDNHQLSFPELKKYVEVCYEGKYSIDFFDGKYVLVRVIEQDNLQQIYYGAPGTGKSYQLKQDIKSYNHIRTIFHPDSDYSSFVGCYKPVTEPGTDRIKYLFRPQAFINAYVNAWLSKDPYYLIIEEINRGNCAQIFGDIFQLLDRKNGISDYTIVPDTDLKNYLHDTFHSKENQTIIQQKELDIPQDILDGTGMRLPANFFLRATMNTSDQSLFPMDSAFKRRWAWKYFSIKDEGKKFKIQIDETHTYDWWKTISTLNGKIYSETKSADKQIGYWFAKLPEKKTAISKENFVSKVLFYLWNDVFKDYGFDSRNAFSEEIQFEKFFTEEGKVKTDMVIKFMDYNHIVPDEKESSSTDRTEEEKQ